MRTAPALQAGDELQQNPVQPVTQAGLVPVRLPGMLLALVGNQSLHVVVVEGLARQFQVTIPQGVEDGEAFLPAAPHLQSVLRFRELQHPGVALGRALLAGQGVALLGQEIEPFRFDLRHPVGSRPGDVGKWPVGSTPGPDPGAFKSRGDLHHVPVSDPQFHFAGVRHHLYHIPVATLVYRLSHQRLKPGPDFARREVAGGSNEFHPEGHAPLAAVAQLEHGAAGQRAVVHKVEHPHLVKVKHHFEFGGGDDLEALVAIVHLVERADEPGLLHLHLLQDVGNYFADFPDGFGNGSFPGLAFFVVVFIQMVNQLGLGRYHVGAEIRVVHRSLAVSCGIQRGC